MKALRWTSEIPDFSVIFIPFRQHFSDSFCVEILVAFKLLTAAKNIFRVELNCDGGNFRFAGLSHTGIFHHCHSGRADKDFAHLPRTPGLL